MFCLSTVLSNAVHFTSTQSGGGGILSSILSKSIVTGQAAQDLAAQPDAWSTEAGPVQYGLQSAVPYCNRWTASKDEFDVGEQTCCKGQQH